jgi:hypothetical protein
MIDPKAMATCAHSVATIRRISIFEEYFGVFMPNYLTKDAMLASPPIVGRRFKRGGLLIFSINPGGGNAQSEVRTREDALLYPQMELFKAAQGESIVLNYTRLVDAHNNVCLKWSIYRDHIEPVLKTVNHDMDDITYANILPFRCAENKYPKINVHRTKIIVPCLELVVKPLIELCKPSLIVFLGKVAEEWAGPVVSRAGIRHACWSRERALTVRREQSRAECLSVLQEWWADFSTRPAPSRLHSGLRAPSVAPTPGSRLSGS